VMRTIFRNYPKGEDGVLATRGGDVRGASRARQPHEQHRGGNGPARWARTSARGSSACGPPALDPRGGRGRAVLRAERRHDVLLARLRQRRFSAGVTLWFVSISMYVTCTASVSASGVYAFTLMYPFPI